MKRKPGVECNDLIRIDGAAGGNRVIPCSETMNAVFVVMVWYGSLSPFRWIVACLLYFRKIPLVFPSVKRASRIYLFLDPNDSSRTTSSAVWCGPIHSIENLRPFPFRFVPFSRYVSYEIVCS